MPAPSITANDFDPNRNLTEQSVLCFIDCIDAFHKEGGLRRAAEAGIDPAKAFQRVLTPMLPEKSSQYERSFSLDWSNITKPVLTSSGVETSPAFATFARKMGLLHGDDFALSEIALAIKLHKLSIQEYALWILSKQGIYVDDVYKKKVLTVLAVELQENGFLVKDDIPKLLSERIGYDGVVTTCRADLIFNALLLSGILRKDTSSTTVSAVPADGCQEILNAIIAYDDEFEFSATPVDKDAKYDYMGSCETGIVEAFPEPLDKFTERYPGLARFAAILSAKKGTVVSYTKDDFLNDVFIQEDDYNNLVELLDMKHNIILQGPPGVGKTFAANRLAWSIIGAKDTSKTSFVQLHQSYSYEDFIAGFRPNSAGGFAITPGVFFKACLAAINDPDSKHFFIIDEINRGNMSKVFGELLMLIESDKRGTAEQHDYSVCLPNSEDFPLELRALARDFFVPKNLYIVGMMNTADRSIAMIDYALRRRFSFVELTPAFNHDKFNALNPNKDGAAQKIFAKIIEINNSIKDELGSGFQIGHSYFCKRNLTEDDLKRIINHELFPMFQEYWFDDDSKPSKAISLRQQLLALCTHE